MPFVKLSESLSINSYIHPGVKFMKQFEKSIKIGHDQETLIDSKFSVN